jgi:hypothetical protein
MVANKAAVRPGEPKPYHSFSTRPPGAKRLMKAFALCGAPSQPLIEREQ